MGGEAKYVRESNFQREVKEYLELNDCILFHSKTVGMPDLGVIAHGIVFFLEIKRHSKNKYKATDAQLKKQKEIRDRGHFSKIITSDMNWQHEIEKIIDTVKKPKEDLSSSLRGMVAEDTLHHEEKYFL